MTQAIVTLDDGTKVKVSFDTGEPEQLAPAPETIGTGRGIAANILQGASLGFSDEAGSAVAALMASIDRPEPFEAALPTFDFSNFGDKFNDILGTERANLSEFNEQNPGTALASTVAGGFATAPAAFGNVVTAGATKAAQTGAAILQGMKVGALSGAGFADSDAKGIAKGALEGAAAGGLFGGVFKQIGFGFSFLKSKWRPGMQKQLSDLAEASGLTPQQIKTRLSAMGPKATIADVDELFLIKADDAVSRLGSARKNVRKLIERDEGSFGRIRERIQQGIGGEATAAKSISDIKTIQETLASPLYAQARKAGAPITKELDELLKRPAVASAWREAKKLGASDPDVTLDALSSGARPSIDGWQRITQRLNSKIGKSLREGDKDRVAIFSRLRNEINNQIDAANPAYKQARQIWSNTSAANDMIEQGANFNKMTASGLREFMQGLSESDKTFFRMGVGQDIEQRLAKAADTANLARRFSNPAFREKARALFPDGNDAEDFINTIRTEAIFKTTANMVGKGSQTFQRQTVANQAQGIGIGVNSGKEELLKRIIGNPGASGAQSLDDIGNMLLSQDPGLQNAAIRLMESQGLTPSLFGREAATSAALFPFLNE